jgi:hypothetical protein
MKHFWVVVVLLALDASTLVEARNFSYLYYRTSFKRIANVPDRIGQIDTAGPAFEVVSRKVVSEYNVTELTQFTVNGKPGKFEDIREGMRVSVVADGKTASRVDARDLFARK